MKPNTHNNNLTEITLLFASKLTFNFLDFGYTTGMYNPITSRLILA